MVALVDFSPATARRMALISTKDGNVGSGGQFWQVVAPAFVGMALDGLIGRAGFLAGESS